MQNSDINAQYLKSCAEDKETVSGLHVSEKYIINLVLALQDLSSYKAP